MPESYPGTSSRRRHGSGTGRDHSRAPRLVILVGLQASGKTTFVHRCLGGDYVHVSKDHWPNARRREARQRRMVAEALAEGRSVVVDNTNPSAADRAPLIALGHAAGVPVIVYWFPPDLDGSFRRNAVREGRGRVPDIGVRATLARLSQPRREEGFDEMYAIHFDGARGFTVRPMLG